MRMMYVLKEQNTSIESNLLFDDYLPQFIGIMFNTVANYSKDTVLFLQQFVNFCRESEMEESFTVDGVPFTEFYQQCCVRNDKAHGQTL